MDVAELLSYKPAKEPKRGGIEEDNEVEVRSRGKRLANVPESYHERRPSKMQKTQDENKENRHDIPDPDFELPEAEAESGVLDETNLKKLLLAFEKKVLKNQELRIKFPDQPEKFMDSEIDLNDTIIEMHIIATQPDLYHILVELNSVSSILGLLTHDNTDISIAIVDLLQEMTDIDTLNESEEGASSLIDAMLEAQVIALLVQNLERLDESVKEEAEGVHNTLAIVENLAEFKVDMCIDATEQGLMQWILKRIKAKMPFDANKLYCSEILSILLQRHDDNRQALGTMEGIDVLLQQLAYFKRNDPSNSEEHEMMENLFDCLCSSLMFAANRERFLKGEGLQLMNLMLREKKMSRNGALKVLDHAMCNAEGADNCNKFVDILGLRSIFPLFMKTPKKNWKKGLSVEQHEEHVCSIIASMLKNCKGTQRQRLLNKFTENDHEKVDRLMELHFKYLDKVHYIDLQIEKEKGKLDDDEIDVTMEEEFYLRRLEGGLFTLQLIDYIMVDICCSGPASIKQRVLQILNLRGGSIKTIRNVMREYAGNMGDANDAALREAEQQRLLQFVDRF
ncbi:beta-catenin-like protein 1 [Trichonephila clavipes]|uniref:Beta-catenin-like protein 1 n=1 Tax=Trichonephila clavipes TaxID=2585209 RepID=A0A8X6RGG0_TRICX|nr:beta-catenin-like protein 1 [Trichonephila clavipes]